MGESPEAVAACVSYVRWVMANPEQSFDTEWAKVGRPPGQLALSVLTSIFASAVGLSLVIDSGSGFLCSTIAQPSGQNITHGGAIVLLGGIVGLLATIAARNSARFLSGALLGEAAMLSLGIGLVARDSATARTKEDCGFLSSSVSTSTHHVQYAYVLLGVAVVVLLTQAVRGSGRPQHAGRLIAGVISLAAVVAALPGEAGSSNRGPAATRPPNGVLVCKASLTPMPLGDPHCHPRADVGRAPIRPPRSLMCVTVLHGVRSKLIDIRAFYGGKLFRHANLRSSDGETSPYVYFDRSDVPRTGKGTRLAAGHYRCTFLVNGTVVRSRTITVRARERRG